MEEGEQCEKPKMEQYHNRRQIRHYFLCDVNSVLTSVLITYGLLKDTSQTVQDTKSKNETAVQSAKLMSLYQNKYLHIPEYIINAQDEKLTDYMKYSQEFADTAKS